MLSRNYLLVLNIINAIIFVLIILIFSSIFNFNQIIFNPQGELVIFDVIDSIKNVLTLILYFLLLSIAVGIAYLLMILFGSFPYFNSRYMFNFIQNFFKNYLNLWFSFPDGEAPQFNEMVDLIIEEIMEFLSNFYLFSFQIFFLIAMIYFIRAIYQNDPKYSLTAIGSLVVMIVIPLMVFGFEEMLLLFISDETLDDFGVFKDLKNPISEDLTNLPLDNFFEFLASPVALLAIVCYIYLEIAFQINYTDTVTKPSLERSERLETQLNIIRRESQLITTNADKIKEEAKKRREEIEEEGEKVIKFFSKTSQRFSYVKEMIEKRKLEEEEKKLVSAASKTRRLGRYMERLFREDSEAEDTLTAKSSSPQAQKLAISTVINFSSRIFLLIIISFVIIHPRWFYINVFNLPPAITESVAMFSPEVVLTLLIPTILLFPVISWIISYIKHRNLIIRLKQEGRIKEILASVGDYVKKEEVDAPQDQGDASETGQVATETA